MYKKSLYVLSVLSFSLLLSSSAMALTTVPTLTSVKMSGADIDTDRFITITLGDDATGADYGSNSNLTGDVEHAQLYNSNHQIYLNWSVPPGIGNKQFCVRATKTLILGEIQCYNVTISSNGPFISNGSTATKTPTVIINNGESITMESTVMLTMDAQYAKEMAISEFSTFPDAKWISYSKTKEYILPGASEPNLVSGDYNIYVIFRGGLRVSNVVMVNIKYKKPAPLGTIVVQGGAATTATPFIKVNFTGNKYVDQFQYGLSDINGFQPSAYQSLATSKDVELKPAPGIQHVCARFKSSKLNLESEVVCTDVSLDFSSTLGPIKGIIDINNGETATILRDVDISFSAIGATKMVLSNTPDFSDLYIDIYTQSWYQKFPYKPVTWKLKEGAGAKTVYAILLSQNGYVSPILSKSIELKGTEPVVTPVLPISTVAPIATPIVTPITTQAPVPTPIASTESQIKLTSLSMMNYVHEPSETWDETSVQVSGNYLAVNATDQEGKQFIRIWKIDDPSTTIIFSHSNDLGNKDWQLGPTGIVFYDEVFDGKKKIYVLTISFFDIGKQKKIILGKFVRHFSDQESDSINIRQGDKFIKHEPGMATHDYNALFFWMTTYTKKKGVVVGTDRYYRLDIPTKKLMIVDGSPDTYKRFSIDQPMPFAGSHYVAWPYSNKNGQRMLLIQDVQNKKITSIIAPTGTDYLFTGKIYGEHVYVSTFDSKSNIMVLLDFDIKAKKVQQLSDEQAVITDATNKAITLYGNSHIMIYDLIANKISSRVAEVPRLARGRSWASFLGDSLSDGDQVSIEFAKSSITTLESLGLTKDYEYLDFKNNTFLFSVHNAGGMDLVGYQIDIEGYSFK